MQCIVVYFFVTFCVYNALVNSAPINQTESNSYEAKHQKAIAIASHLLEALTKEQDRPDESQLNEEEFIEYIPIIDDYYFNYEDLNVEEPPAEINDVDDIPLIDDVTLMKYLEEQYLSDENLLPMIHTPIIDDGQMNVNSY